MGTIDTQTCEMKTYHDRRSEKYKKILVLCNAHLTDYQPGSDIHVTRGSKFLTSYHTAIHRTSGEVSNTY